MPHFFLMDESEMQEADGARLRARLHIRAFWTLMQHKRFAHGVCALYDGFHHALRWFYLSHALELDVTDKSTRWTHEIYKTVEQSELVTIDFDFESFEGLLAQALRADFDEMNPDFDFEKLWVGIEKVFHALEIMPFDVNSLPEENEATRKAMDLH
jgi:hypothetical protein